MLQIIKLFCVSFIFFRCDALVGDFCTHEKSGSNGTCALINNCADGIRELKKGIFPQICGFNGTISIICCPLTPVVTTEASIQVPAIKRIGEKCLDKCNEYARYVYIDPTLLIGGIKARVTEYPHMALIGYDNGNSRIYACGGSLISENFVLTAGHCLITSDFGEAKYVRVGVLSIADADDDSEPQELKVVEIIKHPDYKKPSKYNDIGLLKLERSVRFTPYVRPLCLNVDINLNEAHAIATGWGKTENGSYSNHLLKVSLELYDHDECSVLYTSNQRKLANGIDKTTQLCAGSKGHQRKDTCQGDSGGPLQIFHPKNQHVYIQVGVTSFGKLCGITNTPGVYTKVAHYIDWIEKNVWKE